MKTVGLKEKFNKMGNRKSFEQVQGAHIITVIFTLFAAFVVIPLNAQNLSELGNNWRVDKKLLPKNFRFIYNSDGDNMFLAPAESPEKLYPYIDEVARAGVTTFFMSPQIGMPVNFPTKVGDMTGQYVSAEKFAEMTGFGRQIILNLRALMEAGHDPLGLILDRAREKKMEVFVSFRPNEVHAVEQEESFLFSTFWKEHPEWRIGKNGDPLPQVYLDILGPRTHPIVAGWLPAGLNFAIPQVRAQRLAELREVCQRYNIDGLEIDFQRFPMYFKPGEETRNIQTMTQWMREVRAMTKEEGAKRGRPILFTSRIMATPEQNLAIGLEPLRWAKEKIIDFVTVSHYLHNNFPLPIKRYRKLLPKGFPLYASIEVEPNMDAYKKVADRLWESDVDGILLFNFFTPRGSGKEPPFNRMHEIGYPATLKAVTVREDIKSENKEN